MKMPITIGEQTRDLDTISQIGFWDAEKGFYAQLRVEYNHGLPAESFVLEYRQALYLYARITNDLLRRIDKVRNAFKEAA